MKLDGQPVPSVHSEPRRQVLSLISGVFSSRTFIACITEPGDELATIGVPEAFNRKQNPTLCLSDKSQWNTTLNLPAVGI